MKLDPIWNFADHVLIILVFGQLQNVYKTLKLYVKALPTRLRSHSVITVLQNFWNRREVAGKKTFTFFHEVLTRKRCHDVLKVVNESVSAELLRFRGVLSLSHNWSYGLLRVVYPRILMTILQDSQVHLTILKERTLTVRTSGAAEHA